MNEIELFGVFGQEITAADVKAQLAAADRDEMLTVRIDSPGGSVYAGNSIHAALEAYDGPKRAVVESFAGSIASYLLTAFDEVEITANGYVMIHNPSMMSDGDDEDHARDAKLLADIKDQMIAAYAAKMGAKPDDVAAMMKTETTFNAEQALQAGLVSSVMARAKPTAIPQSYLDSMPFAVVASVRPSDGGPQPTETKPMADPVAATISEIKAAYPKMSSDFVLNCLEKKMPMNEVAKAAAESMDDELEAVKAENEELKAKVAAMEEEYAKAMEESDAEAKAKAEAEAKAKGNQPVASADNGSTPTATARWNDLVSSFVDNGFSRQKAIVAADRKQPGLRQEMLEEVNA